jgi:trehalose 6-phosphate phosphatase
MELQQAAIGPPERMALFLDVDGTLIDFAERPDAVRVPPELPSVLGAAARRVDGALALISGRTIADLDRLMAPLRLPASGVHGAEMRAAPDAPAAYVPGAIMPPLLVDAVRRTITRFPGTMLEDKGVSLAVHYRGAPAAGTELRTALLRCVTLVGMAQLELMAGELVYEIKPAGFDKGSAVRDFMQLVPFAGRRPVFVSDHPIDQAGFDAAVALGGVGLSVGSRLPGTAGWFTNPEAVRAWLHTVGA